MASVKWLKQIDFLDREFDGFFQKDDYVYVDTTDKADGAPLDNMRVSSLFTSHPSGAELPAGPHQFSGIAWSGQGQITSVDLSIDNGKTWHAASLSTPKSNYAWTRWQSELNLQPSAQYEIWLRATDSSGGQQPLEQYWNKGGYGNNLVQKLKISIQ